MKRTIIVKLGSTFPEIAAEFGDFEDWIARRLGLPAEQLATIDATQFEPLPRAEALHGVVLSGSHSMVTAGQPWSERVARWLRGIVPAGVPTLGICYGHQLLAHALGGQVGPNPRGVQFGTVRVRVHRSAHQDRLFGGLPQEFSAHVVHWESVLGLPSNAHSLGSNRRDPHPLLAVAPSAWGVQFHPEFDRRITAAYIRICSDKLRAAGEDPAEQLASLASTPVSASLLARFGQIAQSHAAAPRP